MPTAAPAPNPTAPIRVAECRRCGQLFAVYATEGEIACPACEAATSVASLEIVELSVAVPVEPKSREVKVDAPAGSLLQQPVEQGALEQQHFVPRIEASEQAAVPVEEQAVEEQALTPEPVDVEAPTLPASKPQEETSPEVAEAPLKRPTVAEWLLQSEKSEPRANTERPAEGKRSLAESLGWTPGSFDPESITSSRDEAGADSNESPTDPSGVTPEFATTLKDFKFDFGATPLSEPEASDANDGVSLELSTPAEEAPQPLRIDEFAASKPRSRGWGNFIGMAIGLMLVAGPAAYFAVTWESGDPGAELARLDDQTDEAFEPATQGEADVFASNAAAADPVEDDLAPPMATAPADPFLDSSTKPVSFDKGGMEEPEIDLPASAPKPDSDPKEVTAPADAFAAEADPFMAKPQAATTPVAGEDRYAATPAEPAAFAPPEEAAATTPESDAMAPAPNRDEMIEPVAAITEPREFAMAPPTRQIGLVNAPRYGARELAEAFAPAEAAAVGFATGSLDDPEQVSTMGQHYAHLCHLAQVVTLLDTSDPGLMTAELQAADTFKRVLRDGRSRDQSRRIAGPWIAWTGRPHGGVFFAGMPADLRRAGELIEYQFSIGESIVPVVMAKPIDPKRFVQSGASEVGVIGVVVENPMQWIAGYEGDAQRVVWARKTLPLSDAGTP